MPVSHPSASDRQDGLPARDGRNNKHPCIWAALLLLSRDVSTSPHVTLDVLSIIMSYSVQAVFSPHIFSSNEKVGAVHLNQLRSDKTLRNGVEYGSQSSNASTALPEYTGLGDGDPPSYQSLQVKRIVRKVDRRLPPVLALLYLLSYLDRSNVGNAKIAGLTKDLHMSGHQYNISLTVFFFPYALFMVPSNIMVKKIRPSIWLSILMVCWGITMTMQGLVETYGQLCATRALLGVFESGFVPGATYLLTMWYTRFEYQTRIAMFFASANLANAFSGLLAYAIEKMDGISGKAGWRWIFLIEGMLTVAIGSMIWLIMPDSPQTCRFLTPTEKEVIAQRLEHNNGNRIGQKDFQDTFDWTTLRNTVLDWRTWLLGAIASGQTVPFYAFTFFAPTIVKGLGYKTWKAQLMVVPLWGVACIATLISAVLADRCRRRWLFVIVPYSIAACGFLAMLSIPHPRYPGLTYGFMFLIPLGLSCGIVTVLAWVGNNFAPSWRRAIAQAFTAALANMGGAIGSNVFLEEQEPRYWLGFSFCLGVLLVAIAATLVLKGVLAKINAKRDCIRLADVRARYTQEELDALGDRSPLYRYVL